MIRLIAAAALSFAAAARAGEAARPEVFGLYTARLDGTELRKIVSDPWREMTHNRVSPDGRWITFSRYNDRRRDGLATEEGGGYENTEVLIARVDGTDVRAVVPPRKDAASVNSNWTPDGKGLIYLEMTPEKKTSIKFLRLNAAMKVEKSETLPLPANLIAMDPHQVGDTVVFPALDLKTRQRGLYLVRADGSGLRRLTTLTDPKTGKPVTSLKAGENDPKLSPDGAKAAFMRLVPGRHLWHIFVVDVVSGAETDLSAGRVEDPRMEAEGIPEWSSDGRLLIVWNSSWRSNRSRFLIMGPDGAQRRVVPVPQEDGGFYRIIKGPAFFPGSGSGPDARIIFSAKTVPLSGLEDGAVKRLIKRAYFALFL